MQGSNGKLRAGSSIFGYFGVQLQNVMREDRGGLFGRQADDHLGQVLAQGDESETRRTFV